MELLAVKDSSMVLTVEAEWLTEPLTVRLAEAESRELLDTEALPLPLKVPELL